MFWCLWSPYHWGDGPSPHWGIPRDSRQLFCDMHFSWAHWPTPNPLPLLQPPPSGCHLLGHWPPALIAPLASSPQARPQLSHHNTSHWPTLSQAVACPSQDHSPGRSSHQHLTAIAFFFWSKVHLFFIWFLGFKFYLTRRIGKVHHASFWKWKFPFETAADRESLKPGQQLVPGPLYAAHSSPLRFSCEFFSLRIWVICLPEFLTGWTLRIAYSWWCTRSSFLVFSTI